MRKMTLEEYKQCVCRVLFAIDDICRDAGLTYYLHAGTLLGAVRHKGFIPWDDDIDIGMKRSDYNKLAELINNGDYGLSFIRIEDNEDTIFPYGKICDTNTVLIEKNFRAPKGYGAFVDVFPLDYVPDDSRKRKAVHSKYLRMIKMITHASRTGYERTNSRVLNMKRWTAKAVCSRMDVYKMVKKMNEDFVKFSSTETSYIGVPWEFVYPSSYYRGVSLVEFEGRMLSAPLDPDAVLKIAFGDYMQLPPEDQRVCKHQLECFVVG